MKKFAVYVVLTVIVAGERTNRECMVFGVEAHNNCSAEHKLLDNTPRVNGGAPVITNALAFDVETEQGEYFTTLLTRSYVYDLRDFMCRCRALAESRNAEVDALHTKMQELCDEYAYASAELNKLQLRLREIREEQDEVNTQIDELCELYGMHIAPMDMQGLA